MLRKSDAIFMAKRKISLFWKTFEERFLCIHLMFGRAGLKHLCTIFMPKFLAPRGTKTIVKNQTSWCYAKICMPKPPSDITNISINN